MPITSGSSFPSYCIPFSRKRPQSYLSAYTPGAEWYTPAGVPYPKSMKIEPLGYCYQDEMMAAPAISLHSQQHQLYTTQDIFASQQYVYPSLQGSHFCSTAAAVDTNFAPANTWSTAQPTTSSVSPVYTSMTYEGTVSMSAGSTGSPTPSPCENPTLNNPLTPPTSGGILNKDNMPLTMHHSPSRSPVSDCQEAATSSSFPTLPIQSLSGSHSLPGAI